MTERNVPVTYSAEAVAKTVVLLGLNSGRKRATFYNDSKHDLFIYFDKPKSDKDWIAKLQQDDYYELPDPIFTGNIYGRWSGNGGTCQVTELE